MRITATSVCMFLFLLCTYGIQAQDNASLLQTITQRAAQLQLSSEEARSSVVSSTYEDSKTGIRYLYLQQTHKGVKVFNSIKTVILRNNEVLYSSGRYVTEIESKTGIANPQVTATAAVSAAAEHLKLKTPQGLRTTSDAFATEKKYSFSPAGIAKQDINAELFWVASDDGQTVRLAWNINIDVLNSSDWWNVRIDALNGQYIEKDNWTVYEAPHQEGHETHKENTTKWAPEVGTGHKPFTPPTVTSATYRVFPFPMESPNQGTHALETNPWLKAGAGNNAITNGWHFDGVSNYNITRGNNVFAYLDLAPSNTPTSSNWPDTSSTADPSLTFTSTPSLGLQPDVINNRKSAVTNLFYWSNIIHDVTYQYGFDEASGNFQTDNLSRGGLGNDYVQAEAQDASGTDNANFSTPADGGKPRMQMFLWSATPKVIVNAPASIAGNYDAVESGFSTANKLASTGPVTGQVVWYEDGSGTNEACVPAANSLTGKIALINRGNCDFVIKVKNAQNAGAIGVIMINNVPGAPIIMGGSDNTITIPAMMVSDATGITLASQIATLNATLSPGVKVDGDYDNGVVVHEYGHGISNRLTGGRTNASCLNNAEQGGEGWSDYFSLMLTHKWGTALLTDGAQKRAIGNFVIGMNAAGPGIRNYPYSTNMANNPHTYADLVNVSTQVHYIGEVWCSALWDMTWNIIQQVGSIEPNIYNASSNGGNAIAMRLVMEGLKLQPCRPGFLDARDAILAADSILYNGAYKCAIWKAFARRGMGVSAVQGLSTNASDNVAAFDIPSAVTLTKSSTPAAITSGTNHTVTLSASCQCATPQNNYIIRDTIPAGFSYVSSTGGTLSGNVVTFSSVSFATAGEVKTYSVTIKADAPGCAIDTVINDNREALTTGGLTPVTITGSANWAQSTLRAKSGTNSWFATGFPATGDYVLVSNSYTAGPMSILSFWHYHVMETKLDGSRVEISPDNGTTWLDAGPYIVQNGYNTKMASASPWGTGADAFSGVSYGQTTGNFKQTMINLAPFSGATVKIRFRVQTSASNSGTYEGWFVDDIMLMNGCGGTVKAGLYNSTGAKIDSAAFPVFIRPALNAPATVLNQPANGFACPGGNVAFSVSASSAQPMTYQWQLSTDNGNTYNDIAGATSSTYTVNGVTAAMNGHRYRVVINNGFGATTSAAATLSLTSAPTTSAVASTSGCAGSTVSFTSTTSGAGVTFQWQVSTDGGITFNNVPGATTATLSLPNIAANQNGNRYRLVASNTCGVATSDHGTLTVNASPAVTLTPVAALCNSDAAVSLNASVSGGTWSGTGVSGSSFNPAGLTPGNYTISHSVTGTNGCTTLTNMQVTIQSCASTTMPLDAPGAVILVFNPSLSKYHLRFNTSAYTKVKMVIHSSEGRQYYGREISGITYGHTEGIYTDNMAAGLYLVTIFDEASGKQKTFKMAVERK